MSSQAEVAAGLDRSFLWRRLHSLSGVFPIGAFLLEHLLTNFYATRGPEAYNEKVRFLAELPAVVRDGMDLIQVDSLDQVLAAALLPKAQSGPMPVQAICKSGSSR